MPGVIIIRRAPHNAPGAAPPFQCLLFRRGSQVDEPLTWGIPYGEYDNGEDAVQQDVALPSDFRQWARRRSALRAVIDLVGGGVGVPAAFVQLPECRHRKKGLVAGSRSCDGVCLPPGLSDMLDSPGLVRPLSVSNLKFQRHHDPYGNDNDGGLFVYLVPPEASKRWKPRGAREARGHRVDDTYHEHGAFYGFTWANVEFLRRNPHLPPIPGSRIPVISWVRDLFADAAFNAQLLEQLGYLEDQSQHGNGERHNGTLGRSGGTFKKAPSSPPAAGRVSPKTAVELTAGRLARGTLDATTSAAAPAAAAATSTALQLQQTQQRRTIGPSGGPADAPSRDDDPGFLLFNATTHRFLRCVPVKDNNAVITSSADWRECEPFRIVWHSGSKKQNLERKKQDPAAAFFIRTVDTQFYLRSTKNGEVVGTKEAFMTKAAKSPMESWQLWKWRLAGALRLDLASKGGAPLMSSAHKRHLMIGADGESVGTTSGISASLRQEWLPVSIPSAVGREVSIGVNHLGGCYGFANQQPGRTPKYMPQLQEGADWLQSKHPGIPIKVHLNAAESDAKTLVDLVSRPDLPYRELVEGDAHPIISLVVNRPSVDGDLWWSTAEGTALDEHLFEEEEQFFHLAQHLLNVVHPTSRKVYILQNETSDTTLQRASGVRYPSNVSEAMIQRYTLFLHARQRGVDRARRLYGALNKGVSVLHAVEVDSVSSEKEASAMQVVLRVLKLAIVDAVGYAFTSSAWDYQDCGIARVELKKRLQVLRQILSPYQTRYGKTRFPSQFYVGFIGSTESETTNTKLIHIERMVLEELGLSLGFFGSLYSLRRDKQCYVRREDGSEANALKSLIFAVSIAARPFIPSTARLLRASFKTMHGTFITSTPQDMRRDNLCLLHYPESSSSAEPFAILPNEDRITVSLQTRHGLFCSVANRDRKGAAPSQVKLVKGVAAPSSAEQFMMIQESIDEHDPTVILKASSSGGFLSARSDGEIEHVDAIQGKAERFEIVLRSDKDAGLFQRGITLSCKCSRSYLPSNSQAMRLDLWDEWKESMRGKRILIVMRGKFQGGESNALPFDLREHAANMRHTVHHPLLSAGCQLGFFVGCTASKAVAECYSKEFGPNMVLGDQEGDVEGEWAAASEALTRAILVASQAHFAFDFVLMLRPDCVWREPFSAWGTDPQKISFPFRQYAIAGGVHPVCARSFHAVPRGLLHHFQEAIKQSSFLARSDSPENPHWANIFEETKSRAGVSNVHICIDGDWPSEAVDVKDIDVLPNPFYSLGKQNPMCNRGGEGHHMTVCHPCTNDVTQDDDDEEDIPTIEAGPPPRPPLKVLGQPISSPQPSVQAPPPPLAIAASPPSVTVSIGGIVSSSSSQQPKSTPKPKLESISSGSFSALPSPPVENDRSGTLPGHGW